MKKISYVFSIMAMSAFLGTSSVLADTADTTPPILSEKTPVGVAIKNTPVFKIKNMSTNEEFYVLGEAHKDKILAKLPNFAFFGETAFYSAGSNDNGLTPIFRLYDTKNKVHLYVKGESHRDRVLSKFPEFEFTDGAPAFYTDPNENTNIKYTFNSSEAGAIIYSGDCSSTTAVAVDGDNTITFDSLSEGTYSNCKITVTDSSGNSSQALAVSEFTVVNRELPDITPPVITLNGDSIINLTVGDTYTDQGATCTDDTDATCSVVTGGDSVDTNTAGTYVITYNASDNAGNHATEVTRNVIVSEQKDKTNPKITPSGTEKVPMFRLYNKRTGAQLYARGEADKNKILRKYKDFVFTDGAPAFYASLNNEGLTPIYRLYNTRTGTQLYTRGKADRDKILKKYKDFVFTDGVPAFYASLTDDGSTPIYRLYNKRTGMQLYTRGKADRDKILKKYKDFVFTDGVPAFYAELTN